MEKLNPIMACGEKTCPGNPMECKMPCDFGYAIEELISKAPGFAETIRNRRSTVKNIKLITARLQPVA